MSKPRLMKGRYKCQDCWRILKSWATPGTSPHECRPTKKRKLVDAECRKVDEDFENALNVAAKQPGQGWLRARRKALMARRAQYQRIATKYGETLEMGTGPSSELIEPEHA
jgi:hypothetical protein